MSHSLEEMDAGKLEQNIRGDLEKLFLEHKRALSKSEDEVFDLKNKLELSETQKKQFEEILVQNVLRMQELLKKHDQSKAENIELRKKLDQSDTMEKDVQKKHEESEARRKEFQKKFEQSEAEKKELQKKHEQSEAQIKELQKKLDQIEAQKDEIEVCKQCQIHLTKQMKELQEIKDELQEARKELINGWESTSRALIGVKRMGEIESKPIQTACKRKYPMDEADDQAAALCSLWEQYLGDSNWKPFKTLRRFYGHQKKTIDKEDEKLKNLKDEFGDEVYNAVATALWELDEYNPSGKYPISELWNFKEGRKAPLREGISYLLKQLKLQKRRRS